MPTRMAAPIPTIPLLLATCLAVAAPTASAQPPAPDVGATDGAVFAAAGPEAEPFAAAQPERSRNRPDFLFGQPRGIVGFSSGWLLASGGGLLGDFRNYLTIDETAYDTMVFRFLGGFSLAPRVDLVFDVSPSQSRTASEYRFWDEGGRPISQSTEVWQIPVNATVRYWVLPRGRSIGRLAWVPSTLALHVGAGVGTRWYRLLQIGDFVDDNPIYGDFPPIFTDRLQSGGWAATRHVAAGASIRMTRRLHAVAEVRRVWSGTALTGSFFGDMDMSGLQMTGGLEFVF